MSLDLRNRIGERWEAPAGEPGAPLVDASDGTPLGVQANSSAEQVERACERANSATGSWASVAPEERADRLEACARALDERADAIADIDARQTGVLLSTTQRLAALCGATFRAATGLLRQPPDATTLPGEFGPVEIQRKPLGPAAIIAPWNAPSGIACHKLSSALAAGCPAVFKQSEWAQGSAQLIAEALVEHLPVDVFQLLHGDGHVGARLVADERIAAVSFTGGLEGGRAVAASCAQQMKPAQLELGGSNPLIVLSGADLDAAADGVITALTTLNGQWCLALGRLIVQQSIEADLLERVERRLAALRVGPARDPNSDMGPLVHAAHREALQSRLAAFGDAGARLIQPAPVPGTAGAYLAPTLVLGATPVDTREELFGPVAFVQSFGDEAEAIRLANDSPFGLAAYVYGPGPEATRVAGCLRSGMVKINGVSMLNLHPDAPRPAWGLSGIGDEGNEATFEFFRGTRVLGAAGPAPGGHA